MVDEFVIALLFVGVLAVAWSLVLVARETVRVPVPQEREHDAERSREDR